MKKIVLAIGLYLSLSSAQAQVQANKTTTTQNSSSNYQKRKLKLDEVSIMSSYYTQDGNRSAVTGGLGTEKLTDYANSLDLKLSFVDKLNRIHNINIDANIDYYTSASSDKIDSTTISSASSDDIHFYPNVNYSITNKEKRQTIGLNASYSTEWDYKSYGGTLSYSKASKDNNTEITAKAGVFLDKWTLILPVELRPTTYDRNATKPRNSYNLSLSVAQVINKRLDVLLIAEPAYQEGLLSTPFHRINFADKRVAIERLPTSRLKLPIGLRANYFLGDNIVFRSFYRYYLDNWGMVAHTANLEVPIKINSFFSVSPFYRFNRQSAVRYYKGFGQHTFDEAYYTSDPDIGGFDSHFIGSGVRLSPPEGVFGNKHFSALELRYGYYARTNTLRANIVTLMLKFK